MEVKPNLINLKAEVLQNIIIAHFKDDYKIRGILVNGSVSMDAIPISKRIESPKLKKLLNIKLVDIDFTSRAQNVFRGLELKTLRHLVRMEKSELRKYRSFGKFYTNGVESKLESLNLKFGMDV